jgi:hypothetical protein
MVSIAVNTAEFEVDSCATGAPVVGISPATDVPVLGISPATGAPVVGISPAIAVAESTQANAAAKIKRFIWFSFVIEDARTLVIIPDTFRE